MADVSNWPTSELKRLLRVAKVPCDGLSQDELVARARALLAAAPAPAPEAPARDSAADEIKRVLACPRGALYEVLGCGRRADAGDLKKAYRRLALRLHPDKCKLEGSDEAFKRVSAAYAALGDPGKRREFDVFGSGDEVAAATKFSGFGDADAAELFAAVFGEDEEPFSLPQTCRRLAATRGAARSQFYENPWTLVTLLSFYASAQNLVTGAVERFGARPCAYAAAAGVAAVVAPPKYRPTVLLTAAALYVSGVL